MKWMKINQKKRERKLWRRYSPQALQILFPTSSLLQRGVVLVPQFAQQSAPTAARTFLLLPTAPPGPPPPTLASLSIPALAVKSGSITAAATALLALAEGESAAAALAAL